MSSAVKLILGVSVLTMAAGFAGCDSGGTDEGGAAGTGIVPVAGSGNTGTAGTGPGTAGTGPGTAGTGTGGASGAGTGGGAPATAGVPLTMSNGWVSGADNILGIQGAMFTYADPYTTMTLTSNLTGVTAMTTPAITTACMKGTAPKVPAKSDMTAPCNMGVFMSKGATDCYGEYWGAAIGLNLNQMIDMASGMGAEPAPFDASGIKGFAFELSGENVPTGLRFKVDEPSGVEYCTPSVTMLKPGENTILFTQLFQKCFLKASEYSILPAVASSQKGLGKIAWQVVTKDGATIPFDFCVSNVRAIPN